MRQKYMNICDLQLYLLLVSRLFLFIFLVMPIQSSAEWIQSQGSEYIDRRTTIDDACKNALMKAKRNALSKASLERIQSNQIQICSENKVSSDCKLFESTFDYIDGGFINEIRQQEGETSIETLVNSEPLNKCVVKILANVIKYKEKPDPNYILSAKLVNKPTIYEGEKVIIKGEVNQKSFISVYGWYPDLDANTYHQIFPNEYDKNQIFEKKINIPRNSGDRKYQISASFPKKLKKNDTQEILIVIATKKKFDIINEQKIVDFRKRLNNLGSSNWKRIVLGYTILKD